MYDYRKELNNNKDDERTNVNVCHFIRTMLKKWKIRYALFFILNIEFLYKCK